MFRMNVRLASVAIMGVLLMPGCNGGGEQQGGPGADVPADPDQEPQAEENTFTASLSEDQMELQQGQRKELTLSLERGEQFDQSVDVTFDAPPGLTVLPERATIDAKQTETKVMIEAEPGADTAEHALQISFEPATGKPVQKVVTVTVVEPEQ